MSRPRYEPDPYLQSISLVIPDDAINEFFPANYQGKRGKPYALTTAQYYRIHLLTLLKGLPSFNRISRELAYHQTYRRFAQLQSRAQVPQPNTLSDFRAEVGPRNLGLINDLLVERLFAMIPLPPLMIAVPDSTDLVAACSGRGKKNALVPDAVNANVNTPPNTPPKVIAPRNRVNRNFLSATKNTPCA